MNKLAIIGAGGHGKVVADAALAAGWADIHFFDSAWPVKSNNGHWPVVGNTQHYIENMDLYEGVVIAIGVCKTREVEFQTIKSAGGQIINIIHPKATLSPFAKIGKGVVIFAGAVINVDAVIGNNCIINTAATIDHDCILKDSIHIAPGAHISGNVTVGFGSSIGVGATIRQGIHIGDHAVVGAGAVVVKDIPNNITVVGNPAKILSI